MRALILATAIAAFSCFVAAKLTMVECSLQIPRTYSPAPNISCLVPNGVAKSEMAALTANQASAERSMPESLHTWRSEAAALPPPADTYVSILSGSMASSRYMFLSAVQDLRGGWRVKYHASRPDKNRDLEFALSADEGRNLERLLRSPCMFAEPAVVPSDAFKSTCADGPAFITDFAVEGRRRTVVQGCKVIGTVGAINHLLVPLIPAPADAFIPGLRAKSRGRMCAAIRRWAGPIAAYDGLPG